MRWIAITAVTAACGSTHPRPAPVDELRLGTAIDGVVHDAVAHGGVLGVAVVVMRGDRVVRARGYGFTDAARTTPMTEHAVVALGSLSKQYWSAAVMQLVEAGRLSLDEPVQRILPSFPDARVTVRHLLDQTSGLGDDVEHEDDDGFHDLAPGAFAPGTMWMYSNRGALIVRKIVETVTGADFAAYLRDRIAAPLALHATTVCPGQGGRVPGWTFDGDTPLPASLTDENMTRVRFVCADAVDVAAWERGLDHLLRADSLAALRAPTRIDQLALRYGLFTRIAELPGHRGYGHTGTFPGIDVATFRFPDDDLTIVALENSTPRPGHAAVDLAIAIARAAFGSPAPSTDPLPVPAALLAACPGDFVAPGLRLRISARDTGLWAELVEPAVAHWSGPIIYRGGADFIGGPGGVAADVITTFTIVDGKAQWIAWGHRWLLDGVARRAPPASALPQTDDRPRGF
jgi:CubicO group peptidase (beta-lactamase class C family)